MEEEEDWKKQLDEGIVPDDRGWALQESWRERVGQDNEFWLVEAAEAFLRLDRTFRFICNTLENDDWLLCEGTTFWRDPTMRFRYKEEIDADGFIVIVSEVTMFVEWRFFEEGEGWGEED